MYIRVVYCFICVLVTACASYPTNQDWPTDLPAQTIFIEYCQQKNGNCKTQAETEKHLTWIKRFYYGTIFYPTGWNEMIDILPATLNNPQDKITTRDRLNELGLKIVLEWSQDNSVRLIDSQMLSTWANALATSAEKVQQIEFITRIEDDVTNILSGTLASTEITPQRYYAVEDYDNF